MTAALTGALARRDYALTHCLTRWRPPRWIRWWMLGASRSGDGYLWGAVGAGLAFFGGPQRLDAVASAGLAAIFGIVCFMLMKRWVRRPRPCTQWPHAWATIRARDEFSFPSGHSLTAFAVVTPLVRFYPELGMLLLFCAVSVAISRLMLGLHFLSDVLAGSALGAIAGCVCLTLLR